ncbi:MAG: hypothetical protein JSR82_06950 [Verrucomicrobia bacterium]|nr:hypothetical protein [Verrucomicrobiota bacterium]
MFQTLALAGAALLLAACETTGGGYNRGDEAARLAMRNSIAQEAPGDYWVGRRYYNANYKFWGYLRRPGQLWGTAQLVVINEQTTLAPDRALGNLGIDNNSEYRIRGGFTGIQVYEPASNRFYPEFKVTKFELVNSNPPSIFPPGFRASPTEIATPER